MVDSTNISLEEYKELIRGSAVDPSAVRITTLMQGGTVVALIVNVEGESNTGYFLIPADDFLPDNFSVKARVEYRGRTDFGGIIKRKTEVEATIVGRNNYANLFLEWQTSGKIPLPNAQEALELIASGRKKINGDKFLRESGVGRKFLYSTWLSQGVGFGSEGINEGLHPIMSLVRDVNLEDAILSLTGVTNKRPTQYDDECQVVVPKILAEQKYGPIKYFEVLKEIYSGSEFAGFFTFPVIGKTGSSDYGFADPSSWFGKGQQRTAFKPLAIYLADGASVPLLVPRDPIFNYNILKVSRNPPEKTV